METALGPIRDTTNNSNAMINQSMEEIFAARAIITVLATARLFLSHATDHKLN